MRTKQSLTNAILLSHSEVSMNTQNQARAMMMRHTQNIRNRQQSMLDRTAAELGLDLDSNQYTNTIQGKPSSASRLSYDRSNSSMS